MGGGDWQQQGEVDAQPHECHGRSHSLHVHLPALAARFCERIG
jgi:hypothetical protein